MTHNEALRQALLLCKCKAESQCARMQGAQEVIVEPLLRDAVEFSCLVLGTEEGPVAGMPLEVSIQNPDEVLVDAQLEMTRFFSTTKASCLLSHTASHYVCLSLLQLS